MRVRCSAFLFPKSVSSAPPLRVEGDSDQVEFGNLENVLREPGVQLRIFGKPEVKGHRRMAVILATDETVAAARAKAERAYNAIEVTVHPRNNA